jgi:threonyl-tRNA synthetase
MFVIGEKEQAAGSVAVRERTEGDKGSMPLAQAIDKLELEARERLNGPAK